MQLDMVERAELAPLAPSRDLSLSNMTGGSKKQNRPSPMPTPCSTVPVSVRGKAFAEGPKADYRAADPGRHEVAGVIDGTAKVM